MSRTEPSSRTRTDGGARLPRRLPEVLRLEDWWAVWLGATLLLVLAAGWLTAPELPGRWGEDAGPLSALSPELVPGLVAVLVITLVGGAAAVAAGAGGPTARRFARGFPVVFAVAVLATFLGGYEPLRFYGVNDVIWALVIGLTIANTVGTPAFLRERQVIVEHFTC